jgi:hypothetical protein
MSMHFAPIGTAFKQKTRKSSVAAKDGVIQRGGVPVATSYRHWPPHLHHEPDRLAAASSRKFWEHAELRLSEGPREVGSNGLQPLGFDFITAGAGRDELLLLGKGCGSASLIDQLGCLHKSKLQCQAVRTDAIRGLCLWIGTRLKKSLDVGR